MNMLGSFHKNFTYHLETLPFSSFFIHPFHPFLVETPKHDLDQKDPTHKKKTFRTIPVKDVKFHQQFYASVHSPHRILGVFFGEVWGTLPETNIFAPENRPTPKRKQSSSNHPFSKAKMLVSQSVSSQGFLPVGILPVGQLG